MNYVAKELEPLSMELRKALSVVSMPVKGEKPVSDALDVLGQHFANKMASPATGPAVVVGLALDFDHFSTPIIRHLKGRLTDKQVACHCIWTRSTRLEGRNIALVSNEYRQRVLSPSAAIIATSTLTDMAVFDALLERVTELYPSSKKLVASAIVSKEIADVIGSRADIELEALVMLPVARPEYPQNLYGVLEQAMSGGRDSYEFMPRAIRQLALKAESTFGIGGYSPDGIV